MWPFNPISAAASSHSIIISGNAERTSGESTQPLRPSAGSFGIVMPLDKLELALSDADIKIKELNVKLAKYTLLETAITAFLSIVDTVTTGTLAGVSKSGQGPTLVKANMTINDILKLVFAVINLLRAYGNETELPHSDDAFSYSFYNLCISAGLSEEKASNAAGYLGNGLNALSTVAGTVANLDAPLTTPAQKLLNSYVTYATAGIKALASTFKSRGQEIKNKIAEIKKEKEKNGEEIRQRKEELQKVVKLSHETQITIETQEKSADTASLVIVADQGTQNTIESCVQSTDTQYLIKLADAETNTEIRKNFGFEPLDVDKLSKSNRNISKA